MLHLLSLPPELRSKIWSLCTPDKAEVVVCHCFHTDTVRQMCWSARKCLTIELNEDIPSLRAPPLLLVNRQTHRESKSFMQQEPHLTLILCLYVCAVMFLYNATHRQRGLVDRIRLTEPLNCPPEWSTARWREFGEGTATGAYLERVLGDRLVIAADKYYRTVRPVQPICYERESWNAIGAEVEVRDVDLDEPSCEEGSYVVAEE